MAQIIKHRRGSLEGLAAVTSSINKGELVIATGSSNLSVSNGTSIVFAAAADGQLQAVNRILLGTASPSTFTNATYNGLVNGVPFYDSTSGSLWILGTDSNTKLNLIGNINSFSQSVDSRLGTVETSLGGGGSIGSRVAGLEALTGSYNATTASLNTFTSSQNSKNVTLQSYTASMNTFTASQEAKDVTIGLYTSSMNTFTASQEAKNVTIANYTASMNSYTASTNADLARIHESTSSLNAYTASLKTAITVAGSDVTVNGNLTVAGTTTAINSTVVSIGDNIIELNGTAAANGGLLVKDPTAPNTTSGSLLWDSTNDYWKAGQLGAETKIMVAGGDGVVTGSAQITLSSTTGFTGFQSQLQAATSSLNSYTASATTRFTRIEESTASLNTFSASALTRFTRIEESTSSLNTFSASVNGHIADINLKTGSFESKFTTIANVTASFNTATASLNTFSASALTRFTRIEESTASINLTTASLNGHVADINTKTGSFETKFNNIQASTASLNTFSASTLTRLSRIEESTASINTFTQSANSRLTTLEGTGTIQGVGTGNNVTFNTLNTTGNLTVGNDLVVLGNTVTLNVAELVVEDKLINLASGSTTPSQADGAGIAINGASASFTYAATPNAWTTNIPISSSAVTASLNVPGFGSSKRIAFRETTGNLDFVTAPVTSGDLLQWNGTAFTMSNVIDGGQY